MRQEPQLVCRYVGDRIRLSNGYILPSRSEIKALPVYRPKVRVDYRKAAAYVTLSEEIAQKVAVERELQQSLRAEKKATARRCARNIDSMFLELYNQQTHE